jgi:hypothetical protein
MPALASLFIARRLGRRAAPPPRAARVAALLTGGLLGLILLLVVNWLYQVVRKPTELLAPVAVGLAKTPRATWETYGTLFEAHATAIMTPELLAALAQAEGRGNPLARTYWRFKLSLNPFEIYRPASSAVGMFQITDGTFAQARRYCIHDRQVVADGAWYDPRTCWFNALYSRVVPSHAIEMTSAYLHRSVADVLAPRPGRPPRPPASLAQQHDLAAVIHLCGARRAEAFARQGFRAAPGERCGDHDLARYVERVRTLRRDFARLRSA